MTAKEEIKEIRKIIKSYCPSVSIKAGTGTVWGSIYIEAGKKNQNGEFTAKEKKNLFNKLGFTPGPIIIINDCERKNWLYRLCSLKKKK